MGFMSLSEGTVTVSSVSINRLVYIMEYAFPVLQKLNI